MEHPTPEQVAAARRYIKASRSLLLDNPSLGDAVLLILAHLDAVEAERDANRHELDQLVQETLIPLQQELAEARGRIEALSTLLEWNREAMEAFGVTGGPDITDAIQWAQRQKQALAEARSAILIYEATVQRCWDAIKHGDADHQAWLKDALHTHFQAAHDLPAVKRAMEEG